MKKLIASIFTAAVLTACFALSASALDESYYKNSGLSGTTLNVYNWGEYISDGTDGTLDVNKKFEELTGIKVNYTNYSDNEDMYGKLKSGGASYDVIIPSDYMVQRLISENMLEKLDFSEIPNYKYTDSRYKDLYFDKNNEYSVPYMVGMVGLIYNTKLVSGTPDSWSIMWDKKYSGEILMFNNPRDAFGIAQYLLGQDVNSTDKADWQKALEKLEEEKPLVKSYVMDEIFNLMESGSAAIAPYYAGDFLSMKENNPDLAFVYPKEGTNAFVDSMCIPTTTQNKKAAELYINFMCEPDIALANAEAVCYASPNTAVTSNDSYSLKGNEILYPSDENVYKNVQYFHNLPSGTLTTMTDMWDTLKNEDTQTGTNGGSSKGMYIGLGIFAVVAAAFAIIAAVRKKRREKE